MIYHFLAMASNPEAGGQQGMGIVGLLPWIAIIAIIYFLMIRPQAKRQKRQQEMLKAVKKGDKVVTAGGIHGEVVGIKDNPNVLIVQIADKVKVEMERSSIGRVVNPGEGGETKSDSK